MITYTIQVIAPVPNEIEVSYNGPIYELEVAGLIREVVTEVGDGGTAALIHPFVSQTSVTFNHNLGRKVSVTVFDAAGKEMVAEKNCSNNNYCIVTFLSAKTGTLLIL